MFRKLVSATIIGTALIATPAMAGGSVSLNFHPANPQDSRLMQTGLRLYALAEGIQSGRITQKGSGNAAGIAQNGRGNLGIVHQDGRGHTGTISQNGDGHAYGLFQFGRNTEAQVVQSGRGQAGATFQYGW